MSERAEERWRAVGDRQATGDSLVGNPPADTFRSHDAVAAPVASPSMPGRQQLVDQLCDDQVKRWRAGQRVPAESYLALYPSLQDHTESALELIYGEFLLREEMGESPQVEEFQWRFPRFAARLQKQLDLHGVLMSTDSTDDSTTGGDDLDDDRDNLTASGMNRLASRGFKILGELGRGGMGAVYKAWQVRLKRVVALKVIRADAYADAGAAARFLAEAEAAARLQHPNIVPVFEVGEHEGMGYLVLEYEAGGGLDRKLAGMLQDPKNSARLIETLARAMHHAHQNGIVHRDLKPANVLLTDDGIPKIGDFGLAKLLERDDRLTQVGDILGTPSYMAPEQIRGAAGSITPATDVYALGAILYEMLTGRPPFKGTTPLSTMEQVSSIEPLSPGKLQRHTPARSGDHLPQVLAERSAPAIRDGERVGGRPASVPRPATDPGPAHAGLGARLEMGPATPGCGERDRVDFAGDRAAHRGGPLLQRPAPRRRSHRPGGRARVAKLRTCRVRGTKPGTSGLQRSRLRRSGKAWPDAGDSRARQGLLDTAIAGLEEISRRTAGSPPDLSQAAAHEKLGDMYRIIGRHEEAGQHYEKSRELAENLLASDPENLAIREAVYQTRMGLGLLYIATEQFVSARTEFERAASISARIAADDPTHHAGRQGLIEAYLQIGRAHSFQGEYAAAETWFRKMQTLAEAWVTEEPGNHQARDLLASSLRKLADLKKFSKDYAGARQDYESAIAIGRDLMKLEPHNLDFKYHLAIALDDLAGVVRDQGELEKARRDVAGCRAAVHGAGRV